MVTIFGSSRKNLNSSMSSYNMVEEKKENASRELNNFIFYCPKDDTVIHEPQKIFNIKTSTWQKFLNLENLCSLSEDSFGRCNALQFVKERYDEKKEEPFLLFFYFYTNTKPFFSKKNENINSAIGFFPLIFSMKGVSDLKKAIEPKILRSFVLDSISIKQNVLSYDNIRENLNNLIVYSSRANDRTNEKIIKFLNKISPKVVKEGYLLKKFLLLMKKPFSDYSFNLVESINNYVLHILSLISFFLLSEIEEDLMRNQKDFIMNSQISIAEICKNLAYLFLSEFIFYEDEKRGFFLEEIIRKVISMNDNKHHNINVNPVIKDFSFFWSLANLNFQIRINMNQFFKYMKENINEKSDDLKESTGLSFNISISRETENISVRNNHFNNTTKKEVKNHLETVEENNTEKSLQSTNKKNEIPNENFINFQDVKVNSESFFRNSERPISEININRNFMINYDATLDLNSEKSEKPNLKTDNNVIEEKKKRSGGSGEKKIFEEMSPPKKIVEIEVFKKTKIEPNQEVYNFKKIEKINQKTLTEPVKNVKNSNNIDEKNINNGSGETNSTAKFQKTSTSNDFLDSNSKKVIENRIIEKKMPLNEEFFKKNGDKLEDFFYNVPNKNLINGIESTNIQFGKQAKVEYLTKERMDKQNEKLLHVKIKDTDDLQNEINKLKMNESNYTDCNNDYTDCNNTFFKKQIIIEQNKIYKKDVFEDFISPTSPKQNSHGTLYFVNAQTLAPDPLSFQKNREDSFQKYLLPEENKVYKGDLNKHYEDDLMKNFIKTNICFTGEKNSASIFPFKDKIEELQDIDIKDFNVPIVNKIDNNVFEISSLLKEFDLKKEPFKYLLNMLIENKNKMTDRIDMNILEIQRKNFIEFKYFVSKIKMSELSELKQKKINDLLEKIVNFSKKDISCASFFILHVLSDILESRKGIVQNKKNDEVCTKTILKEGLLDNIYKINDTIRFLINEKSTYLNSICHKLKNFIKICSFDQINNKIDSFNRGMGAFLELNLNLLSSETQGTSFIELKKCYDRVLQNTKNLILMELPNSSNESEENSHENQAGQRTLDQQLFGYYIASFGALEESINSLHNSIPIICPMPLNFKEIMKEMNISVEKNLTEWAKKNPSDVISYFSQLEILNADFHKTKNFIDKKSMSFATQEKIFAKIIEDIEADKKNLKILVNFIREIQKVVEKDSAGTNNFTN